MPMPSLSSPPPQGDEAEDPGLPLAEQSGGRRDGDGHTWAPKAHRCPATEKEQGENLLGPPKSACAMQ